MALRSASNKATRTRTGNADPKVALLRKATTAATATHGQGGRKKTRNIPKPITLVKLKFLEPEE